MRKPLLTTTALATALLLAACATAKPVATAMPNPTPAVPADEPIVTPSEGFAGLWYVSGVFPRAADHASIADPHLGAALLIDAAEVSDVNGQRCTTPGFTSTKVAADGLGLKAAPAAEWDSLTVTCDGKAFATYVRVPTKAGFSDKAAAAPALLQQRPEALYLLEQAGTILYRAPEEALDQTSMLKHGATPSREPAMPEPVQSHTKKEKAKAPKVLVPENAPEPVLEGPVAAKAETEKTAPVTAASETKIPAPGTAIHLASYKGESAAKRGWKLLLGDYDELDPLSPLYVPVDVPGKGAIIRLYATGGDKAELTQICTALKAKQLYCSLNP